MHTNNTTPVMLLSRQFAVNGTEVDWGGWPTFAARQPRAAPCFAMFEAWAPRMMVSGEFSYVHRLRVVRLPERGSASRPFSCES